jgi:hypothetical protein
VDVVDRVIAALNAHDLDAFVACYGADAAIELGDGTPLARGHDELRARYGPTLAGGQARIEVLHRVDVGTWVVQEERVTGRAPEPERHVALYRVENGLIAAERLLR